jgi:ABC transport system ATP-binding/permease protein
VQTLAVLEDYLEDFNGCVIVVSHDRYFLDRTIDMVFSLEPGGNLRLYPGNYSVYLDHKKAEEAKELKAQKNKGKLPQATESNTQKVEAQAPKPNKLTFNEKREYDQLEAKIPQLEAEKAEIEQILSLNSPSRFGEVKKLSERLGKLNQEIEKATEKWMELAERVG